MWLSLSSTKQGSFIITHWYALVLNLLEIFSPGHSATINKSSSRLDIAQFSKMSMVLFFNVHVIENLLNTNNWKLISARLRDLSQNIYKILLTTWLCFGSLPRDQIRRSFKHNEFLFTFMDPTKCTVHYFISQM